jgi:hypothetical protein
MIGEHLHMGRFPAFPPRDSLAERKQREKAREFLSEIENHGNGDERIKMRLLPF